MTNSVDPDQTAPIGAVCSGSKLFASIFNSSVMLGNYLQQTTSADDIFRCIFFLALYGVNTFLTSHDRSILSFKAPITTNSVDTDQTALGPHCLSLYILFTKSRGYLNSKNYSIYQTNVINLKQLVLISKVISWPI